MAQQVGHMPQAPSWHQRCSPLETPLMLAAGREQSLSGGSAAAAPTARAARGASGKNLRLA